MTFEERHQRDVAARAAALLASLHGREDGIYRREEAADNLDLCAVELLENKGTLWFVEYGGKDGMYARWRLTVVGKERAAKAQRWKERR